MAHVLGAGVWRGGEKEGVFGPRSRSLGEQRAKAYPISSREEIMEALQTGSAAAEALRTTSDETIAKFLELFAGGIEQRANDLVELAHTESGLPKSPRLKDAELPRTTDQLRQAARAAREGSWRRPIRDEARKIYSLLGPLGGPVVVMGPNNFPFAFNSAAGGDFAAAIAAHNPVIAKANSTHPGTTRLLAGIAFESAQSAGLHPATVQMIYRMPGEVGLELVAHPLVGATAFTGSRRAGVKLKGAADRAGKPIYLEMSSVNPVFLFEGALRERGEVLADEFFVSCTMGAGQFCTNPGFIILPDTDAGRRFVDAARKKFEAAQPGVLLGRCVRDSLADAVGILQKHGATLLCGGQPLPGPAYRFSNTLLRVAGDDFLKHPHELQTEAFGPVALLVTSRDTSQAIAIIKQLQRNLTGVIYSDSTGKDDAAYDAIKPDLRQRAGRPTSDGLPT